MTDEITATPAAGAEPGQVTTAEDVIVETATTEQQGDESGDDGKQKQTPWFKKRIDEITREKYEARREIENKDRELATVREQLALAQAGGNVDDSGDVQALVQKKAVELLNEHTFNETCNKVYEEGKKAFPDFDVTVSNLQLVGVSRDFLELATTSEAGAKLLHHLGSDLDEAARIASLPPVQMARELTRLEYKLSQKQTKSVSKAPAPIAPISGSQGGLNQPHADMSDAEYAAWRARGRQR